MKIIANLSCNFSARKQGATINSIIIHYTGMESFDSAINRLKSPESQVSAHYCINSSGQIFQLVADENKAWHAGISFWRNMENLNDYSIGIEIENLGHEFGYEKFSDEQINSVIELCKNLINRHDISPQNIVGHSDIAPDRKEDPGELFPWKKLAEHGIGIYHTISYGDEFQYRQGGFTIGDEGKEIGEIQRKLQVLGYKIQKSTIFDEDTKKVITAFYRRFMPERIYLSQNPQYPENIRWDSLADVVLNDLFQKIVG